MSNGIPNITGDILLDAGTNELEVLVFKLGGGWYGVNVAKVREVIRPSSTVEAPKQHASVLGMLNIRGTVVPVVDLARHLSLPAKDAAMEGRIIITEFNGLRTGFLVEAVEQIHRVSWSRVRPSPDLNLTGEKRAEDELSVTTGVLEIGDRLILMIDFESVADAILLEDRLHIESVENDLNVDRGTRRVVIVEDSRFMRSIIQKVFASSGYALVEVYGDGQQAWDAINKPGKPIEAVVSDIEMPRMDGLYLCKRIKEHPEFKSIPVVLFSSLVSDDNRKKGQQVGADAQVAKPELAQMVRLVDKVLSGQSLEIKPESRSGAAA